jgi:hypothetical protein
LEEAADRYASSMWVAMARQSRAELLAAQGRSQQALATYQEALTAYEVAGHDYEAARCLMAMATVHRKGDSGEDEEEAVGYEKQARQLLARLGAPL